MYLDHPGLWTESMRRKKLIADGSVQPSLLYLLDAPGIQVGWSRPPPHHTSPPSHVFILSPSGLPCCVHCISKQENMYLYDPKNHFQHPNSFWQSWMIKENDAACWAWPFINQYKVFSKRGSFQPQSSLNHVVCKSPWRLCSSYLLTIVIASGDLGHHHHDHHHHHLWSLWLAAFPVALVVASGDSRCHQMMSTSQWARDANGDVHEDDFCFDDL